ncbi:alpha/beta fold hydrolase [Gemmobacter lutimaris]|uniref:Alpha/beta fold hydrolase n=1 Tax=Gemmobacter lutimaris TaxID=2306023 RepID=A0A398BJQ0_9RHOB|nr:alpha/beta fold hydrolase [Gemmobacter lutimaris]RID90919.1 alpha/beta fold hydrolase [Gemmobacter lutimaris]
MPVHRIVLGFALTLIVACSPRGAIMLDPAAAQVGAVEEIFVATTRQIDPETGTFGKQRSEQEHFARFEISVPPERKLGTITFPRRGGKPDPSTDFLTTEQRIQPDVAAFRKDLVATLQKLPRGKRDAVVYVHGFNNTFAEGLYRIAQLSHDLNMPGVTLHYSWPSAGNPLGYVADRDSAMFARDGLEELLDQAADAGAERIVLVAHSMGSALTMETLRQVSIRRNTDLMRRISGVILISPDIDVDLFRMQARAYGALPQPFLIFGSDRDTLLNISAKLTGAPERLGNLRDISRVADLKVTFLDTEAFSEGTGHFNLGDSPALIQLMNRIGDVDAAFGSDQRGKVGLLPGVVLTVQSATQIVLSPVGAVAEELAN